MEVSDDDTDEEFDARLTELMKLSSHLQKTRYSKEPRRMEIHICIYREIKAKFDGKHISNGHRARAKPATQVENAVSFEQLRAKQQNMLYLESDLAEKKEENTKLTENLTKQR